MRYVMYDNQHQVLGYFKARGIAEAFEKADEEGMPATVAARGTAPMTWAQIVSVLWATVQHVNTQDEAHKLACDLERDNWLIPCSNSGDWYLVLPAADVIVGMLDRIRHKREAA